MNIEPHNDPRLQPPITRLGKNLRKARIDAGLTQTTLAELIQRTSRYISQVELGAAQPSLATIARIADITGSELSALLEGVTPIEVLANQAVRAPDPRRKRRGRARRGRA